MSYLLRMEGEVKKSKLNEFCNVSNGLLRLPNIFHEFAQQDQTYEAQQAVDYLKIF